jgi:hypothetical protein
MGKNQKTNDLIRRRTLRPLLAVSLAASLAAFGCTTNHNLGNGTPTRVGPELRSAPTSGVTSGSERELPPPMTSSYSPKSTVNVVTPRSIRRSADEAAAIMADRGVVRARYLGPANPGSAGRPYASDFAGVSVNPALVTNAQLIASSSPGSAAIASGAVGTAAVANGATAASTLAPTTAAGLSPAAAVPLPTGTFATAPATTESVGGTPTVTAASMGAAGTGVATATGAPAVTTTAVTTPTAASVATPTPAAAASSGVRLVRGSTGATITNSSAGSTATTSRSQ